MIRGYDSQNLDLVFPRILDVWLYTHTYPQNVSNVGNYTIRGALWSWHAVAAVRAAVSGVSSLERCWWCHIHLASHAASQPPLASHLASQPASQPPRASQLRDNDETRGEDSPLMS